MTQTSIVVARIGLSAVLVSLVISSVVVAGDGKAYGEPLSGSDTTRISALMAAPDRYVGQTVRSVAARVSDHLYDKDFDRITYIEIPEEEQHLLGIFETRIIAALQPKLNAKRAPLWRT